MSCTDFKSICTGGIRAEIKRRLKGVAISRQHMASTIWKGPITFGLVSFPVRLQKAARRERIALRYVRESNPTRPAAELDNVGTGETPEGETEDSTSNHADPSAADEWPGKVSPVKQGYYSEGQR